MKNKFGLGRYIPEEVKRQLRQEAGFGCVICGNAIITYEHISNYTDVESHNPDEMVCLCAGCHDKVTRKLWSKEKVTEAKSNPKAKQVGFANDFFDVGNVMIPVRFGRVLMKDVAIHLKLLDNPVFWISEPTVDNPNIGINAVLRNKTGEVILEIIQNEWRTNRTNWDAKVEGHTLTFRDQENITLKIRAVPRCEFNLEYLNMCSEGFSMSFNNRVFSVITPNLDVQFEEEGILDGCEVGFQIVETGLGVGLNCRSMSFSKVRSKLRS